MKKKIVQGCRKVFFAGGGRGEGEGGEEIDFKSLRRKLKH